MRHDLTFQSANGKIREVHCDANPPQVSEEGVVARQLQVKAQTGQDPRAGLPGK
ncbi:MAG: hypothetical protein LJE92_16920 [Gammaproteobacteria bacterium]|nr:hypothetical protein [Gammaproteobacteria bacterium]